MELGVRAGEQAERERKLRMVSAEHVVFERDNVLGQMRNSMEADKRGRGGRTNAALLLQSIQAPSTERPLKTEAAWASESASLRARQKKTGPGRRRTNGVSAHSGLTC